MPAAAWPSACATIWLERIAGSTRNPVTTRRPAKPVAEAPLAVAEAVRDACRLAVAEAWEDAGVQGLCVEGRCEVALGALERLDLAAIVEATLLAGAAGSAVRGDTAD